MELLDDRVCGSSHALGVSALAPKPAAAVTSTPPAVKFSAITGATPRCRHGPLSAALSLTGYASLWQMLFTFAKRGKEARRRYSSSRLCRQEARCCIFR
jgi:hypothetical protein